MLLALAKLQKKKERILNRQLQMRAFCSAEDRILCVLKDSGLWVPEPGAGHITHQTIAEIGAPPGCRCARP
jgi:hypothetical protein